MEECPNVEFPTVIVVEETTEVVASGRGDLVRTEVILGEDEPEVSDPYPVPEVPIFGAEEDTWSPDPEVSDPYPVPEVPILGANEDTWSPDPD